MTVTCPNGHQSQDPEWCDTCGAKVGAAPTPPPATPAGSVAAGQPPADTAAGAGPAAPAVDCPHCGTRNEAEALFCEGCGYDFTTGQAPPPTEEGDVVPAPAAAAAPVGWVVIVEVDPTWFDLRGELAGTPCPPPTSSTIQLAGSTALIGRTSRTHRVYPEIALDGDTGVSRRHAQLVYAVEGTWSIVDLGSSNGTYIVPDGQGPTADGEAIPVGIPRSLADRDAIYLGAWTKLTLRDAGGPTAPGTA